MDEKIRRRIAEAAAKANDWQPGEVSVEEVEDLRRPSCSFYTASNTVLPLSYQDNYAVLAGNEIIATGDGAAVARILDTCSTDASPIWWAEIVTRFHRKLGGGIVLVDEDTRSDITRKLKNAGKNFEPPVLDKDKRSLTYLFLNPETYILYRVQATRAADGAVEVVKTKLLPAT